MESKNKKEELEIRKASSYDINFPDNKYLENSDKQRIQKAVTDGGISIGNKTFISEKELNKLLVTDRKGVTNAMMSTPPGDLKKVGELSGKPLDGMAEVHHKDRVADKPERAFDPTNLAVIRKDEHSEYHNSDYPQNEKGYEQFEKKYKK